ncbi:MAG: hypothetical protein K2W99_02875, partial [Chthoniobacterales bacterium]|nr:hypothetical protein [Chthoniobacterales bacterium]
LYARQVKEGNLAVAKATRIRGNILFSQAQSSRANALIKAYQLARDQALEAGNEGQAGNLRKAIFWVNTASCNFAYTAQAEISEEANDAYNQVGFYRLAVAKAHAEGNHSQAKNLEEAANAVISAGSNFACAAKAGISKEEKNAYEQAGSYRLDQAKAHAEGNLEKATNLGNAAYGAVEAVHPFAVAGEAGISKETRDAYKQAGFYYLDQAKAHAEGNLEKAENLNKAAKVVDWAAECFIRAAKEGISEEEKNAYEQAGSYRLDQAKAHAEGNLEKATNLGNAAYGAVEAVHPFAVAGEAGISKETRDAYKQAGFYYLDQAKAHAEGNLEKAENLNKAAKVVDWAAECFIRAAKEGISEEASDAYKQAGFYYLDQAKAHAEGNLEKVENLHKAARVANLAAVDFTRAAKEGISEETRDAYKQEGSYRLDQAKAYAEGNLEKAMNLNKAANAASKAVDAFTNAHKARLYEATRDAYKQEGSYQLEVAELWAAGNVDRANNFSYEKYLEEKNRQEWYQTRREPERPPVWKGLP